MYETVCRFSHKEVEVIDSDMIFGFKVPFSNCSVECKPGYVREQDGLQKCCFVCVKCPSDQYSNHTGRVRSNALKTRHRCSWACAISALKQQ